MPSGLEYLWFVSVVCVCVLGWGWEDENIDRSF